MGKEKGSIEKEIIKEMVKENASNEQESNPNLRLKLKRKRRRKKPRRLRLQSSWNDKPTNSGSLRGNFGDKIFG